MTSPKFISFLKEGVFFGESDKQDAFAVLSEMLAPLWNMRCMLFHDHDERIS